ncbi:MAG TPA: FAD-dependent oxidoreductase [Candidatus Saccharimonadales bacterium]|nr:FAD-dependent oxidoreductase [Candidatus Saccharimonadales bacterium]
MKIAIIGAGFTGLSAGYQLSKQGNDVTLFEKDLQPGGLAIGFKEPHWEWTFEKHYHHWFTNKNDAVNHDQAVLGLAKEIGHTVITKRPKTSVFVDGQIFQFDSPKNVLMFPKLSLFERIRMAAVVGLIRYNPFWQTFEKVNASTFLPRAMGKKAYKMIWEPQFVNKFGAFATDVSLAWFWARLAARTASLAYPEGGFLSFANHLVEVIKEQGGTAHFNAEVVEVNDNQTVTVTYKTNGKTHKETFDKAIFTLPSFLFLKTVPQLPDSYRKTFKSLKNLGATNLVLRLKKPFFKDNTYWLSVCDPTSPVMAIVEHTNFIDKKHYDNEHLLYLGNYLSTDSPKYLMTKEEQLKLFDPLLKKINPDYKKYLIDYELFKAPFAQPVIPTNYSRMIPSMTTPLPHIFLANIDQVYPWDRGTSNAVELGKKVAELVQNNSL